MMQLQCWLGMSGVGICGGRGGGCVIPNLFFDASQPAGRPYPGNGR